MSEGTAARWMAARGWLPFAFQKQVWQAMAGGRSGLLHATTGAGKTYAVWLGALQHLAPPPHAGTEPAKAAAHPPTVRAEPVEAVAHPPTVRTEPAEAAAHPPTVQAEPAEAAAPSPTVRAEPVEA
ncbi:MAG: hypothetical protein ACK5OA_11455, partial [Acidovorax sp.]